MILVTGANGFVGSAILKHLHARGYAVRGLIRKSSDLRRLKGVGVTLCSADLNDTNALTAALRGCELVVHCAARSIDWGKESKFREVNVMGVQNLMNASHRVGSVRRIVFISTANISGYGRRNIGESESENAHLRFLYSRSKREGEWAACELCADFGIELVILRPSAVYGPEDWKWSYEMMARIDHSSWPLINGGKALFTPLYIDNLCLAAENAMKTGRNGGIYNLTDDVEVTWLNFCEKIARCLHTTPRYTNVPFFSAIAIAFLLEAVYKIVNLQKDPGVTRYRVIRSAKDFHYSCALAKKELHYKPDRDIDSHIAETVRWYRSVKGALPTTG